MTKKLISIIIPAYKQEKKIYQNLLDIDNFLSENLKDYSREIICVVDGEVDNTFIEAEKAAKNSRNIKVVGYKDNRGKGHAVRFGMAKSKGEIVAFFDAGGDINLNAIPMGLQHFDWYSADIIVGSKRHPVSKVHYPWQRRVLSFGYQSLVRILYGLNLRDTQVGVKFFKREVLEKTLPRLMVKHFAFDIEMLAVANYLGFKKIYESPVEIKMEFGGASILTSRGFPKMVLGMILDTLAVFYRLRILHYYSDKNQKRWKNDPDLNFHTNVG